MLWGEYTLVRVPTNGETAYRVHGWEIGIAADSPNKDAAWTFVNYLLSPEVNARAAKAANALPGNLAALDAVREGADETLLKQMEILSGDTPVEEMRQSPKAAASWSVMTEEIQAMLRGDQSPEEAAAAVQARWLDLAG